MESTESLTNQSRTVTVCIPTYKASQIISPTLRSLLSQTWQDFEVIIQDDTPPEEHVERDRLSSLVRDLADSRFRIEFNSENLGYPRNLQKLVDRVQTERFFLLAQDDLLSEIAIEAAVRGLDEHPEAAAVCRPYYWYFDESTRPVRQIRPLDGRSYQVINSRSDKSSIVHVLVAASQLTGLMYSKSRLTEPFVDSVFPAHIFPIAGAIRDYGVVFLPFNTVAVSIQESQTRHVSRIYEESPLRAWESLYRGVFHSRETASIARYGLVNHLGKNFVGLIQIRTYGSFRYFVREVFLMLRLRPLNAIDPRFILSVLGLALLPRRIIKFLVDNFKNQILAPRLKDIRLATREDAWW